MTGFDAEIKYVDSLSVLLNIQWRVCVVCGGRTDEGAMDIGNVGPKGETVTVCYDCRDMIGHQWLDIQSEWMRFKHWLWRRRHWGWFTRDPPSHH